MEWQPIDTAPKDGARILAVNGTYGARETFWRPYGDGSMAKLDFQDGLGPSGAWNWDEPMNHWASSWTPDYWMPLPPLPSNVELSGPAAPFAGGSA